MTSSVAVGTTPPTQFDDEDQLVELAPLQVIVAPHAHGAKISVIQYSIMLPSFICMWSVILCKVFSPNLIYIRQTLVYPLGFCACFMSILTEKDTK